MTTRRILSAVLALGLAIGACSSDDDGGSSESVDLPDGAAAAVDEYYEAVAVEHDGNAMLTTVTEDFTLVTDEGVLEGAGWAEQINTLFEDFAVERLEGEVVLGEETAYIISQPEHVTGTGIDEFAISVIRVVEVDGNWLVSAHNYTPTQP